MSQLQGMCQRKGESLHIPDMLQQNQVSAKPHVKQQADVSIHKAKRQAMKREVEMM